MANKNSLLKRLTSVLLCRDMAAGGGNSTLAADAAAGVTQITLVSATNFSVGDTVRLGSGSKTELATLIAGAVSPAFNLSEPTARAHSAGDAVVEQSAYDLGDISDSGVDINPSRQSTDVVVATKRLVYQVLLGYGDLDANFVLPGISMENIALALGIPLTTVKGNGAAYGTAKNLVTDLNDIGNEQNASLVCTGVLMDGTPVRVELWAIDPDYTGLSINLRRGTLAGVPCKYIATAGGRVSSNASPYVANTTYRAGKGKVFDGLSEVGVFAAETAGTPANTTIAAASAGSNVAGQNVITVVSNANMAAGDFMKLGSAETSEFHRVASIAALQITLDTPLLRDQAIGVTVVEQKLVPFANIAPDGVTLAITGTVDRLNEATAILSIGTRAGTAKATVGFAILDYTPAGFARAVGIDPSTIVSNTFALDEKMGTALVDGVYVKGVLKDGTTIWLLMWGCSQDVARLAAKMASSGEPSLPTSWVPSSGIALLNHA